MADGIERILATAHTIAKESFITASGPGGQNVNKVATAVQLRIDIFKLGLAPQVFHRLRDLAGSRMTANGEIVITSRKHRTQDANRTEARTRLADMIRQAHEQPRHRKSSRLNRVGKTKRLKAKKSRGTIKANRGKVDW